MASLYHKTYVNPKTGKKTTTWMVSYYRDGKRHAVSAGKSKTVALKLKKRVEAKLQTRKFDFLNQPKSVSIEESLSEYLEQKRALRKPRTYARSSCAISHFRRFMADKFPKIQLVAQLTRGEFESYKAWRREDPITPNGKYNPKKKKYPTFCTINNELSVFRAWLNWAVTAGQILDNPLSGFEKLKITDSKPRRILSRDELNRLFNASEEIEKRLPNRTGQTLAWRFLANTGLRIGELIHLQWKDIDFRRRIIKIQRKPNWDPKTYEREVPFTPGAAEVLNTLRKASTDLDVPVFLTGLGRPYRENKARDWILDCAKRAKIEDVHGPHDMRHTFITMALTEFNMPVPAVQEIVGHTKLETTQRYLHPTTDFISSAAEKFEL